MKTPAPARASHAPARVSARRVARLASSLRIGAVAMLLVFHAVLFWSHLAGGRLFEPAVALRWGIGILLLGLIVALRRVGVPLFWGRRALVVWVLVALLHVGAAMPATATSLTTDNPIDFTLSLVVLPPAAGIVFTAGLLLLGAMRAREWRLSLPAARPLRREPPARLRSELVRPRLAPRAPPIPASC